MRHIALSFLLFATACAEFKSDERLLEEYCGLEAVCTDTSISACLDASELLYKGDLCHRNQRRLLVCLSRLDTCTDYNAYHNENAWDYPCVEQYSEYVDCVSGLVYVYDTYYYY